MEAPPPAQETQRLAALRQYQILDTEPELAFDDLTELAAQICDTSMAIICLIDTERFWLKSKVGLDLQEIPREIALCAQTIEQSEPLIVPDALADERFAQNPLVTSPPHLRFYAGVSLRTPEGYALGCLCVLDQKPRSLTQKQLKALQKLARQVVTQLELRRHVTELANQATDYQSMEVALRESKARYRTIVQDQTELICRFLPDGTLTFVNRACCKFLVKTHNTLIGQNLLSLLSEAEQASMSEKLANLRSSPPAHPITWEHHFTTPDGSFYWLQWTTRAIFDQAGSLAEFQAVGRDITNRKRIEEALKKERDLIAALLNTVGALVVVLDTEGQIVRFNHTCEQVTGYSFAEVQGKVARDLFVPTEELTAVNEVFARLHSGQQPIDHTTGWLTKNGSKRVISWSSTILLNDQGSAELIICAGIDITQARLTENILYKTCQDLERRATDLALVNQELQNTLEETQVLEEELRLQNEELVVIHESLETQRQRYLDLFNFAPDGYLVTNMRGIIEEVNQATRTLFWGKSQLFVGKPLAVFVAPAERSRFRIQLQKLAKQQAYSWEELHLTPHQDHSFPAAVKVTVILDSHEKPIGLRWLIRDITASKLAQQSLQESEERFRQIAENVNGVFFLLSPNAGEVIYVSPAYEEVWGCSCESLYEQPYSWLEVIHPQDRERVYTALVNDVQTSTQFNQEYRIIRPDGSVCWIWSRSFSVKNAAGQFYRLVVVAEDITWRKQLEENLRQQAERERLIGAIAHRIRQSLNLEEILNTTVSQVRQLLKTDRVIIYRFEQDWSGTVTVESVDPDWDSLLGVHIKDPCFESNCIESYRQGKVMAVADIYTAGLGQCYIDLLSPLQVRANLVVPILQGEQLWGLLIAHECNAPRQWQQWELNLLIQLATQVGIAIQQSQLYQQTQQQAQREKLLNRVIQAMRNSLDLKTIFATTVVEVTQLLAVDRVSIMQYLPQQQLWLSVEEYCQNPDLETRLGRGIPDENNEITARLKSLEVVRLDDANSCKDKINRELAQVFPGAWLLIPLCIGSSVWGILSLVRSPESFPWEDAEVALACAVADQLAIAIQQSELYQQLQGELAQRRQAEVALQKAKEELEIRVAERTAEWVSVNYQLALELDIRRQVERALQISKARFAGILEIANDAIIAVDAQQCITLFNQKAEEMFGYRTQEVVNQPLSRLLPTSLVATNSRQIFDLAQAFTTAREVKECLEVFCRRRDQTEFPAEASLSHLELPGETVLTIILRDITERKQAQESLQRLSRHHQLILDSVGEGLCGLNLAGKVTFINPAAARLLRYQAAQLLGQPISLILTPPGVPATQELFRRSPIYATLKSGTAHQLINGVFYCQDGHHLPVDYVSTPIREQGDISGAVIAFKDITERLLVEQMKDEFIAVVSHELRTPLTSINGSLRMLASGLLNTQPDKSQRLLEIAIDSTNRLMRLINDILDIERIESGKAPMEKHSCNAAELMIKAVELMQGIAEKAGVSLCVRTVSAELWADSDRIIQALTNLLNNAIKFSPQGANVWLIGEDQGTQIQFDVKDQGRGIPPDMLEIIFERFQQVDVSDSRNNEGTGLGLAICRSIVEQHGGRIWATSTLGKGTTFSFTVPLNKICSTNNEERGNASQANSSD
ncbi:PAS domain S-box protein [Lyngbya aestuarii]|uniref:PAS domain S-box protein n=1 Tax=Lyngbya aestuarii TaxID=118322 RepID=UPI00403DA07F